MSSGSAQVSYFTSFFLAPGWWQIIYKYSLSYFLPFPSPLCTSVCKVFCLDVLRRWDEPILEGYHTRLYRGVTRVWGWILVGFQSHCQVGNGFCAAENVAAVAHLFSEWHEWVWEQMGKCHRLLIYHTEDNSAASVLPLVASLFLAVSIFLQVTFPFF